VAACHDALPYRVGRDVNKPDAYGWTPLILAQRLQTPDAECFLKQQTAQGGTLPSSRVPNSAIKEIVTLSEDGLAITHESGTQCTISTHKPFPVGLGRSYLEVTSRKLAAVEDQPVNPIMAIGFCTFGAQYLPVFRPGAERNTPSERVMRTVEVLVKEVLEVCVWLASRYHHTWTKKEPFLALRCEVARHEKALHR
jgi:hypothetical protein